MPFFYFDYYYIYLILPAMLLALWAQYRVSSTFAKYSRVRTAGDMTGAQAARIILDRNGLSHVRIEHIAGKLSDHFDPRANVIRLSDAVHDAPTVAAVGVAAHEAGHAVQYARGYTPMKIRAAIIPLTNFGSSLAVPLILLGFVFSMDPLVTAGIVLFSTVALFQLITLPVEFNASNRAIAALQEGGRMSGQEVQGARKVLSAAALTYVAALIVSLAQLLRLVLLYGGRNSRD